MRHLDLKYAFITTYDETIFLRKVDASRHWVLQYSPVIFTTTKGVLPEELYPSVRASIMCRYRPQRSRFRGGYGSRSQVWAEVLHGMSQCCIFPVLLYMCPRQLDPGADPKMGGCKPGHPSEEADTLLDQQMVIKWT
jgi:hypothetical protein